MNKKNIWIAACLLLAFVLWTGLVCVVDVQPIGPQNSNVGFSSLNGLVQDLTGVHMSLYAITDWLSLIPVGFIFGFAIIGIIQLITRKRLKYVDYSILVLGGFYITVLAVYALFEAITINYRPVLIEGVLEKSYPSSTTMLVMCVMPTTIMQFNSRIKNLIFKKCISILITAFIIFTVIGRLISGVHWFTDIIGGLLFSSGLVILYHTITGIKYHNRLS